MSEWIFVSDLHGSRSRYKKLFQYIENEQPSAVFIGGDILPSGAWTLSGNGQSVSDFIDSVILNGFKNLQSRFPDKYPQIFTIFGNDDAGKYENHFLQADTEGLLHYQHNKKTRFGANNVFGYAHVPPTPFHLKDWERYDVSRHVDPGCVSPEEGERTVDIAPNIIRYTTIQKELATLTGDEDVSNGIFLFHTPPYQTYLDRAALDDKMIDHVPLDVHVGSIAVKRFIEARQPLITLHGHIHESARLTGEWKQQIGRTWAFSAAHDGPELAVVRFTPEAPESATRELR